MEGKLDDHGFLLIKRKNEYKEQLCPFSTNSEIICGDWCPLFDEDTVVPVDDFTKAHPAIICRCAGTQAYTTILSDERP